MESEPDPDDIIRIWHGIPCSITKCQIGDNLYFRIFIGKRI